MKDLFVIYLAYLCVPLDEASRYTIHEYESCSNIKPLVNYHSGQYNILYSWSSSSKKLSKFLAGRKGKLFKVCKHEFYTKEIYEAFKEKYDYAEIIEYTFITKDAKQIPFWITTYEQEYVEDNSQAELFDQFFNIQEDMPSPTIFTEEIQNALDALGYFDLYDVLFYGLPYDLFWSKCMYDNLEYFIRKFGNTLCEVKDERV